MTLISPRSSRLLQIEKRGVQFSFRLARDSGLYVICYATCDVCALHWRAIHPSPPSRPVEKGAYQHPPYYAVAVGASHLDFH